MATDPAKKPAAPRRTGKPAAKPAPTPTPAPEPEPTPQEVVSDALEAGQETISIERRQEVASLPMDEDGKENAITLAFQVAAEYIAANMMTDKGRVQHVNLEWVVGDMLFTASVEPNIELDA